MICIISAQMLFFNIRYKLILLLQQLLEYALNDNPQILVNLSQGHTLFEYYLYRFVSDIKL